MEGYLNISTNKNRKLMALAALVFLLLLIPDCFKTFDINEKYIPSALVVCILIVLAVAIKIESAGRPAGLINAMILILCAGLGFAIFQTSQNSLPSIVISGPVFAWNFFICCGLLLIGYCLCGRFRFSLITGLFIITLFSVASYFITLFRGETLMVVDFLAMTTALSVAEGFSLEFSGTIFILLLEFIAALAWAMKAVGKAQVPKKQFQIRTTVTLLFCGVTSLFIGGAPEQYLESWNLTRQYNGYPFDLAVQAKLLKMKAPQGYSPELVADIVSNTGQTQYLASANADFSLGSASSEERSDALPENPNIIIVMNETFADLRVFRDFATTSPVMPFIDELREQENVISGYTEVNVFGGGTCDSEYSVLTGNTTAFLPSSARPYQLYVKEDTPNIAANLKRQGYATYAIHPGERTAWNRDLAYKRMGFDEFFSVESFPQEDLVRGRYVGDDKTYEKIIELYENKGDVPLFVHDVTIANHSPYVDENHSGLETVELTGMTGSYPLTEQYLSLLNRSDEDFSKLIAYFDEAAEPTIILFFGDHQGKIEPAFYEELSGRSEGEWNGEETARKYQTPYLIWANYDIDEGAGGNTAIHNLGQKLLTQTGVDQTAYFDYLGRLAEGEPIITKTGVVTKDGNRQALSSPQSPNTNVENYRKVLYNNIVDTKNRSEELYYVEESVPVSMAGEETEEDWWD